MNIPRALPALPDRPLSYPTNQRLPQGPEIIPAIYQNVETITATIRPRPGDVRLSAPSPVERDVVPPPPRFQLHVFRVAASLEKANFLRLDFDHALENTPGQQYSKGGWYHNEDKGPLVIGHEVVWTGLPDEMPDLLPVNTSIAFEIYCQCALETIPTRFDGSAVMQFDPVSVEGGIGNIQMVSKNGIQLSGDLLFSARPLMAGTFKVDEATLTIGQAGAPQDWQSSMVFHIGNPEKTAGAFGSIIATHAATSRSLIAHFQSADDVSRVAGTEN